VFGVGFGGRPSDKPTVNAEPGTVPFAIAFDPFGHLVIAEAGTNAVSTFQLSRGGTASLLHRTPTGQAATCWVTTAGPFLFASNAGAPSESGFAEAASGQLTLLGNTATDPGAVDAASAVGGRFLYVQTGGALDRGGGEPDGGWQARRPHPGLARRAARQREVVLLRDLEGMSSDEVCAVLALTEGNQRVLLHRGRSRLRQLFEDEFREVR
jgi:hypothetical protein